jgi:hypothetical protein
MRKPMDRWRIRIHSGPAVPRVAAQEVLTSFRRADIEGTT